MTDKQQPEALRLANACSNLTRYSMDAHLIAAELRRQHARIAGLEAQLESIGAGGVSGPLMGCASIAASAGSEPVAHLWQHSETGRTRVVMPDMIVDADASWQVVGPLCLGAAPPTAQAEGWRLVPVEPTTDQEWAGKQAALRGSTMAEACKIYKAMLAAAPLPPTSAEGVEHGL